MALCAAASMMIGCGGSDLDMDRVDASNDGPAAESSADASDADAADSTMSFFAEGGDTAAPPPPSDAALDVAHDVTRDETGTGICGPANCPQGCCDGFGQCIDQPTHEACGWSGSACQQCPANATCEPVGCVVLVPTCSPSNCGGCCIPMVGTTGMAGCLPGTDPTFCGFGGAGCTVCQGGQTCRAFDYDAGGFCQANDTCGPSTCTGCCVGNVCLQGNQGNACGIGGVACLDCASDMCVTGGCVCGVPLGIDCDARGTPVDD